MPVPKAFRRLPYAASHFQSLVDHARQHNPFYRHWISDPENVPIIGRQTFVENNDKILNGKPVSCTTSGSSGRMIKVHQSAERIKLSRMDENRFVKWLGGRLPVTVLVNPNSGEQRGSGAFDVKTPVGEQIELIFRRHREIGAVALTTYPSNAEILARTILDQGLDMSHIRRLGLYGEGYDEHQAGFIAAAFPNAKVWTTYTAMEFGYIALMCPFEPGFQHIMAHKLGVEILDDQDEPCPEGVRGRVVITDYFNKECPFIRYDIGDYAVREACPCGKINLPALSRVYGRVLGSLVHRSGEHLHATRLLTGLRDLPGVRRYQVIQEEVESFVIKLEADRDPALEGAVKGVLREFLGYEPGAVSVVHVDEIPRGENGKYQYSICKAKRESL